MKGNPFASAITQPTREGAAPKEKKLVMSNDVMSTTLRTTVGNIRLLKELAANDRVSMNELLNDALCLYGDSRGVHFRKP
jgi:hypothetical protein